MTAEEIAEKITPCWQPSVKVCECPMHVIRPLIAIAIHEVQEKATVNATIEMCGDDKAKYLKIARLAEAKGFRAGQIAMREEAIKSAITSWRNPYLPSPNETGVELAVLRIRDSISALPIVSEADISDSEEKKK